MNRNDSNHEPKNPLATTAAQTKEANDSSVVSYEWGYLLLENTPVHLLRPYAEDESTGDDPSSWYRRNVWYNVQCTGFGASEVPLAREQEGCCPKCDLVLIAQEKGDDLTVPWETIGPTMASPMPGKDKVSSISSSSVTIPSITTSCASTSSVKINEKNIVLKRDRRADECVCSCRSPRSDAAILFDILQSLQMDIQIIECRVLFLDESFQKAAIYVTLSFPRLSQTKTGVRSLLGPRTSKPLSNQWQLILSLLRSDWENLEGIVKSLQDPSVTNGRHAQRVRKSSVFPPRLTMEELYRRIQGSPFDEETRRKRLDRKLVAQEGEFTRLPSDIIENSLAPFLDARALDGLRRTCLYYHGILEKVVPGLKLGLFRHQISSLVWMRERERHDLWEADCLDDTAIGQGAPDGDLHRAVTGGHTVRLRPRTGCVQDSFRIDTYTGHEFQAKTNPGNAIPRRHVCRGGLLVDEPGLGKTITVLSLILQTAGLSTGSTIEKMVQEGTGIDDKALFNSYWRECVPPGFQQEALNRILNQVAKNGPRGCFPVSSLRSRIGNDVYKNDFDLFVKDLEYTVRESYVSVDSVVDQLTFPPLIDVMRNAVEDYKERMLASAKKSFSNSRAKPNSALASLIEESKRLAFLKSLVSSRGTLIVIPSVLMDHWEAQINMHVDLRYLSTSKIPMVYAFGGDGISLESAVDLVDKGRFEPVVFLDRGGTKALPPADFLAKFLIVITTTSRFSQEWKNGSFQAEVERCNDITVERLYESGLDRSSAEACPLLKIHWLRMIIDEGHSMGRGALGSSILFASWISSERRWAMTGTPTKEGPAALSQVRNLMKFLQHDFFSPRCNGEIIWTKYISRPWKDSKDNFSSRDESKGIVSAVDLGQLTGGLASFFRLRALLKLLMKRHTKADIVELAPPIYKESFVPMSHAEVITYNSLVTAIQSNLLLTSLKKDAQQDSLLHRSQARFAREALANVRRVCVGFSRVIPTLTEKHRQETEFLLNLYGVNPEKAEQIKKFLYSAQIERLTPCDCCGLELSILILLPCCGGMVCTECIDGQESTVYENDGSEKWMHKRIDDKKRKQRQSRIYYKKDCLLCQDGYFDVDNLQLLQPGFVFTWKDNIKEAKTTDGEIPVRIEAARYPGETNSNGNHEANSTMSQNINDGREILLPPPSVRRRTKKPGDGHECEYDRHSVDGRCIHCFVEHDSCNLLESMRCHVCYRITRECPEEETKPSYIVRRCLSLVQGNKPSRRSTEKLEEGPRPIKIIIFSQFRKALNLVGDRLLGRFGSRCVSEYWGRYRTQELHKFTNDPECFCMLSGKDGSEGLDLSFVTHIFFLEEIWDKSLAEQTVARAWRMGARGAVEVETIIAKDSVEETMKAFETGMLNDVYGLKEDESPLSSSKMKDGQNLKTHVLLKSLRLITDYHQFRKNFQKRPLPKTSEVPSRQPQPPKRRKVTFSNEL